MGINPKDRRHRIALIRKIGKLYESNPAYVNLDNPSSNMDLLQDLRFKMGLSSLMETWELLKDYLNTQSNRL